MTQKKHKSMDDQFADWTAQWEKAMEDGVFEDAPKPAQPRTQHSPDFFGQYPSQEFNKTSHESDVEYWKQVYNLSNHQGMAPDVAAPDEQDNYSYADGGDHYLTNSTKHKGKKLTEQKKAPKGKKRLNEKFGDEGPGFDDVGTPKMVDPLMGGKPSRERQSDFAKRASSLARSPNPVYYYSHGKDQDLHVTPNWSNGEQLEAVTKAKLELFELENKINALEGQGKWSNKDLEKKIEELRDRLDNLSDELAPGILEDPLS
jgi:hypothetical protein